MIGIHICFIGHRIINTLNWVLYALLNCSFLFDLDCMRKFIKFYHNFCRSFGLQYTVSFIFWLSILFIFNFFQNFACKNIWITDLEVSRVVADSSASDSNCLNSSSADLKSASSSVARVCSIFVIIFDIDLFKSKNSFKNCSNAKNRMNIFFPHYYEWMWFMKLHWPPYKISINSWNSDITNFSKKIERKIFTKVIEFICMSHEFLNF